MWSLRSFVLGLGMFAMVSAVPALAIEAPDGTPQVPKTEPGQRAADTPHAPTSAPLTIDKLQLVSRRADAFGDITARDSHTFTAGETMRVYMEVAGQTTQPTATGRSFSLKVGFALFNAQGVRLSEEQTISERETEIDAQGSVNAYYNFHMNLPLVQPGSYTITFTVYDKLDGRTAKAPLPFTKAAEPVETNQTVKTLAAENVVQQVDGWDVSRDPDGDGDCIIRYTKAEPQAGGLTPYISIAKGFVPQAKDQFTALILEFTGWAWNPDETGHIKTNANQFFILEDLSWNYMNPTTIFVDTKNDDEIHKLLRIFDSFDIKNGEKIVTFNFTKPERALAALKPCLGKLKPKP